MQAVLHDGRAVDLMTSLDWKPYGAVGVLIEVIGLKRCGPKQPSAIDLI
jgi:hypothetical protein